MDAKNQQDRAKMVEMCIRDSMSTRYLTIWQTLGCRNCLRRNSEHGSVHPSKAEVSSIRRKELRSGFGQIHRGRKWRFSVMSGNAIRI